MEMNIAHVEIEISDNKTFAQVAYFLDSQFVLIKLQKLREKYGFGKTLSDDLNELVAHFVILAGLNPETYPTSFPKPTMEGLEHLLMDQERLFNYLSENSDSLEKDQEAFRKVFLSIQNMFSEINLIRRSLQYPRMFNGVLLQALLFNKVRFFITAYPTTIFTPAYSFESDNDLEVKRDLDMAIIVTANSTKEDVLKAFSDCKTDLIGQVEATHPLNEVLDKDTVSNIKRDRDWHWQQYNSKTYNEIVDEWNATCPNPEIEPHEEKCHHCIFDVNKVEKAVSRYRRYLKSITLKTDV